MKQKLLFIFALLCTVAQGAWAYDNEVSINDNAVSVPADKHWLVTGTGEVTGNKITIGAGATVTLSGVNISHGEANSYCIHCAGSATIILAEGTTNTLTCTQNYSIALRAGGTGTTLTIKGTGTLKAQSGWRSAGIGGFYDYYAGGSGNCGNIVIEGGTIEAKGGGGSAGIGSGYDRSCGNITIANSVKCVSAISGKESATHCIGKGDAGSCGTVTIGGVEYWDGSNYKNYGADYIGQNELNIAFINSGAVNVPDGKYYNVMGTGAVTGNKITIGNGATVMLSNVNIQKENDYCVKCEGSATIILKYNTVNELTSSGTAPFGYPALWVGGSGTKLTIQSETDWYQFTGKLIAQGADRCAAIGGGVHSADHTCGDIEIQGGIITATGGMCAPGIGSGFDGHCGNITITSGVTRVNAKTPIHTSDNSIDCIGRGNGGTCRTVTIGDMVFYDGSDYKNHGDDYIARRELSVACINTANVEVNDGEFCLIFGNGTPTNDYRFSLSGSSTAVLSNVHIERPNRCVNCVQNNTSYITLKDGTTNKLISTEDNALRVGDAGTTLIINGESAGTGKLIAQGGTGHAAIGGGYDNTNKTCGNIQILGGIIEAKGGSNAPAIGADNGATCGNITISNNYLTAKKGSGATDCIGRGNSGSCGTVTIGGVVYYNGSDYQNNGNTYLVSNELAYLKANKGNSSDYWTTFYNEAGHFQAAEGTQVFKAALSDATLTLSPISDRIVNVGKAVILKSNSANIFLTSSNSGTTSEGGYEGNSLRGTTTTIPNPNYGQTYVLNKGENGIGFYKLKSSGTIGAHKAYLTSGATAREFFLFDEETTGVNTLNGERKTMNGDYYDLQGRKVAQPAKGLYIVNGKKVVIK